MKTMKRLLALLLALTMVMPNCLTIASAYDEEIVEEVVEELVEESVETPEEEEVFEEVFEEEIEEVFEEEIYEEETEEEPEEVVEEVVASSVTDDVAAVQTTSAQEIQVYIPEVPYDSDALFADHATSVLYPNGPVTMGTNGYDELDTQGQALYEALAAQFKQIADGDLQLTQITVNLPFVVNINQLSLVVDALLLDVPHNLYWYDKVSGVLLYTETGSEGNYQQMVGFAVASDYADKSQITTETVNDNGELKTKKYFFHTNTAITSSAAKTVRKAQAVATSEAFAEYEKNHGSGSCDTPYAKLLAYVEWICAKVDYDHDAATGANNYFSAIDCDPWQIIYVFDGNPDTKVVCEGYSKALQYLCDIATDYEVPQVITVCGDLSTNSVEGGRHMWNIAVMDGQNYLVDVTNYDAKWTTFLLGGTPENVIYNYTSGGYAYTAQKYIFRLPGGTLTYEYDQDTMTLYQWDLDEITLAEERYPQPGNTGSDADPATYQANNANELFNALEEAAETGGTVVLNGDAQITKAAGIGAPVTLVVEEGVTLTIAEGVTIHVFGNVKVAGTIVNNGNLIMKGGALDVTGTYSGSGTVDNVHAEDLESVSGVRKRAMNIWVSAGTAEALFLGLNYADTYGMVDIRLNGDVTVSGDVTIPENVNLYVNPDITLTITEGFSVQNNGRIINNGGTIVGTIKGNPPETVENGGDDGEGELGGTTEPIEVTDWDSLLAALRQGAGTTVILTKALTAPETLEIPAGVTLYVQADLTTNGELALLAGAELNVADGGSLTTNCAVWVNESSTLEIAEGCSMTAKDAIHVGFTNENGLPISGELKVNGTLDAYGYVNICEDALLTIHGTMTQMPYDKDTGLGGIIIDNKGTINVFGTLNQNHEIYNDGQLAVSGTLNNIKGNIQNGTMSVMNGGRLTGFDLYNQIMLYDGAKLTVNAGADLSEMERASVNVRMDDSSSYSGVADEYIYAVWFPDNTEELVANIAESVNGTKYGHSHFIPETSFTLTQDITIYPHSLLQLWNYDATETYTVVVPAGKTLTTAAHATDPGGIIINAGTKLLVQGTLVNDGSVTVTDNRRGHDDVLEPGILQIAQDGNHIGNGYLKEYGGQIIEGSQNAGGSYLSTYWVHNEGEGAFVNHSYPANPEFRMVPGENFQWIFYFNQWNETTQTWKRTPVAPEDLECGPNVKMTLGKDIEWIAQARGDYKDLADCFVGIEVTGGWDTDSYVRYHYSENSYVDYPIHISRDSNRGFYSSADVADNSTWLYEIQDGPAKENHTFYFHYTGENTISDVKLADEDTFAVMENVKENVWAITLSEDYVNSLWNHRDQRDDGLKVTYTEANDEDYWTDSVDIGIQSYWADMEAGFTFIDKQDVFEGYNYDFETNSWIDIHENGWSLTELPNGITYNYATNTLTLNNVQLNGMHLHYRDDQGNKLLPNSNLTIKLDGTSNIGNPGFGAAVAIGSGLKVAILDGEEAGTGVLNLRCEDADKHIGAIDLAADSQLTIGGGTVNAINADMNWKGEVTITGGTITGDFTGILAENLLKMTGGTLRLTNSSGLSLQAMAEIRNATLDLDNSVMRTMVGTQIHNSTINIDVDEQNTVLGTDDFALWNNGYLAINNGTNLTVKATGFAGKEFYAVKNTGTYHQMGGNVTVTSDASAAGNITATIPAMLTSGTALLNEGTLTLNGQVGYEQYYDENWGGQGEQLLEVAGGILNANGTDAGMLIQGHAAWKGGTVNAYAKSVPIHAGTAPYDPMPQAVRLEQRLVDGVNHASLHIAGGNHNLTAEQDPTVPQGNAAIGLYINNAPVGYEAGTVNLVAGLAMCSITSAADLSNFENLEDMKFMSGEEVLTLTTQQWSNNRWNQGLVNAAGEPAEQATISLTDDVVTIETQADFQQAMEAAIAEGKQSFELTGFVTITENLDLPIAVRVMAGAELTVADGAVLTIQNEKNLTAEYGSITVEAGGRIENNQSQLTNMGGTITINHKDGYAGYVEENGTMMMRSISTPNGLSIGTTTGWPYSKQVLGVTCERLDQISWAIGQAKDLGFRNTEIDIWNSVELTYNLTIPENVSVIINSPRADGGSNEIQPVSMLMVPEGKTLTINAATTEGAVNGSLFMNNGSVLQVDSGATVTNHGYLHIGDWQDGTHEFSGIMNVDKGATVNLYGYTAVHHYNAGSEEQPDYIPAVMNVDGVVNTFRVGDDDGGFLDNNGIVNIAGTVNSGFLFNTSGVTNILADGKLNVEDVLANYDTIYINSGAALIVNGTMAPYGTVINNGGSISGAGSFNGACGTGLNWKLSGTTLTISGEGAMASAPWNHLAFIGNVETVKLTSKLTSILEDAFAQCKSGVSIVIPRAVTSVGDNAFASDANVKIYHGSPAENIIPAENRKYIHEIDPDTGKCTYTECNYDVTNLLDAVQKANGTQAKVDAVTSVDTTDLKEQIQKELNSGATSNAVEAVKEAEQALAEEKDLSVGVQSDIPAIGEVSDDAIVGALLSASEDAEQVTLVVTDAEDIPAVDPELAHKYSSNGAVHFEMTLEGVDDPENLTAPVTVTLPIPKELLNKKIVVVHYGFNGTEVIEPWVDPVNGTATFAVDGFSTFAYSTAPVAYVDEPTNTYGDLRTAINEAKNGSTVTLLAKYEGMSVNVNKAINIDPNGYDLPDGAILVAEGFKKTVENGVYRISAIKQLNSEGVQLKTGLIYNGQEQTVLEQITDGETVLEEGVDYTVTGNKATNAGTYTMTVVGSGDYSGELSFPWSIAKAKISIQVNYEIQVMTPATENNPVSIPLSACQISVEGGNYTDDQLSKLFAEIHPTWSGDTSKPGERYTLDSKISDEHGNYEVKLSGSVTIIAGDNVCWNPATGEYWTDLSDALEAVSGPEEETIQMLKDTTAQLNEKKEQVLIVSAGTTFDLNGYYVEADNVLSYGVVMDSASGIGSVVDDDEIATGGILISNNTAEAWTMFQPSNGGYLPIYDTFTGSYKFYAFKMESNDITEKTEDACKFRFRIGFEGSEVYSVLKRTTNSGMKVVLTMAWPGISGYDITYTMSDATVQKWVNSQYAAPELPYKMTLRTYGLSKLEPGTISAVPSVVTQAGVSDVGNILEYTY